MKFRPFEFQTHRVSSAAVARAFGVPETTLTYRMRKHGVSAVKAAQMPHRRFDSVAAKARKLGLSPDTIRSRIRLKGMSVNDALTRPLSPRGPRSMSRRARALGFSPSTISKRMLCCGMTLDEALTGGKDLRVRDKRGWFTNNPIVNPDTRATAKSNWREARGSLTSRRATAKRGAPPEADTHA
jgi:hypothetical protein